MIRYPLSTWAENISLTLQQIALVGMIWVLSESPPSVMHCAVFVAAEMIFVLGGLRVPERAWPFFLVSNGVFNLLGNISQLWLNFKQRSCGQVSAITLLLSLSGNTVRIFTSMVRLKS